MRSRLAAAPRHPRGTFPRALPSVSIGRHHHGEVQPARRQHLPLDDLRRHRPLQERVVHDLLHEPPPPGRLLLQRVLQRARRTERDDPPHPSARIASTISGTARSSTSSFFSDRAPSADSTTSAPSMVRRTAAGSNTLPSTTCARPAEAELRRRPHQRRHPVPAARHRSTSNRPPAAVPTFASKRLNRSSYVSSLHSLPSSFLAHQISNVVLTSSFTATDLLSPVSIFLRVSPPLFKTDSPYDADPTRLARKFPRSAPPAPRTRQRALCRTTKTWYLAADSPQLFLLLPKSTPRFLNRERTSTPALHRHIAPYSTFPPTTTTSY